HVNGLVRIRLHKGNVTVIGRGSSTNSLYVPDMATYGSKDNFDHRAAEGFIYIWGLPSRLWAAARRD
ncbi:MAG: argininosuccinate synthase, partial [Prochlorococcus sp.]